MAGYKDRAIEETFLSMSKFFKAVLITGPRQCGKTTTLRHLLEQENIGRKYVTLDDFNARLMAVNDPKGFLQVYAPPVFIDEVQYAPQLFSYIKILVDERQQPGDFWLTGSQVFKLMDGVQESLAGRVGILSMAGFSQREKAGISSSPFKNDLEYLLQRLACPEVTLQELYSTIMEGTLPDAVGLPPNLRSKVYSSYVTTYIERDVRGLSGSIDALKFFSFVTAVAAHTGQLVNVRTIAEAADINVQNAKEWLGIMERLGIIFYLHPYSNNLLKRTISKPKLYFSDTGLAVHLMQWGSINALMNGASAGAVLENYVISEIRRSYENSGEDCPLHYYRDKDGNEIDALYEENGTLYPIEIKKTATPNARLVNTFKLLEKSGKKLGTGSIICTASNISTINEKNIIVPVAYL